MKEAAATSSGLVVGIRGGVMQQRTTRMPTERALHVSCSTRAIGSLSLPQNIRLACISKVLNSVLEG